MWSCREKTSFRDGTWQSPCSATGERKRENRESIFRNEPQLQCEEKCGCLLAMSAGTVALRAELSCSVCFSASQFFGTILATKRSPQHSCHSNHTVLLTLFSLLLLPTSRLYFSGESRQRLVLFCVRKASSPGAELS